MGQPFEASLENPALAQRPQRDLSRAVIPARRFLLVWTLVWAAIGCTVAAGFAFATDVDFWPALRASLLFAEVVGFTAFVSARMIFPLFVRLPYALRLFLEVSTLLSATVFGSATVAWLQPLFSVRHIRVVALIVLVNAVLAVIVGISLSTFDRMRLQIEETHRKLRAKEALERDLAIAREVQQGLLPHSVPEFRGIELRGICIPAIGVGGDYYDFLELGEGQLGLVIADVSGKGIPAALLTAGLQASVRALFRPTSDTGELTARLNDSLSRVVSGSRYATLFVARYDRDTRTLHYTVAGHHPPLLLRGKHVTRLSQGGVPIGLFEESSYRELSHQLAPGDLLALFTDGIVESPNADSEEFGEGRLIELLRRHAELPLERIVEHVLAGLSQWSANQQAHDDLTLVLLRVR
jgi:serine phosphatase RsbU (regulator of sigma subunit)